jgi:hypothetical protein
MTNVKGFAFFINGPKGRVAMQTIALQTFLREDGVDIVVFQGQYRGKRRTFSVRRK